MRSSSVFIKCWTWIPGTLTLCITMSGLPTISYFLAPFLQSLACGAVWVVCLLDLLSTFDTFLKVVRNRCITGVLLFDQLRRWASLDQDFCCLHLVSTSPFFMEFTQTIWELVSLKLRAQRYLFVRFMPIPSRWWKTLSIFLSWTGTWTSFVNMYFLRELLYRTICVRDINYSSGLYWTSKCHKATPILIVRLTHDCDSDYVDKNHHIYIRT